jgi:hypothetical protein
MPVQREENSMKATWTFVSAVAIIVVLLPIRAGAGVVTDGLVHQWNIERGEGGLPENQVKDSAGNRDGTFVQSPTWSEDTPGGASSSSLRFDNADGDSVDVGDLRETIDSTKAFTVETWGKVLNTDHGHVLFSAGNPRARPFGMQQTSTRFTEAFSGGTSGKIGGLGTERSGWFEGFIDQVRIYNRALNEEEIQQNYIEMSPHNAFVPNGSLLAAKAFAGLDVTLRQPFVSTETVLPIEIRLDLSNEQIADAGVHIRVHHSGRVVMRRVMEEVEAAMEVDMQVSRLEPGDYTVEVRLTGAGDQALGAVKRDFTKFVSPGKPRTVTIGEDGLCTVNGKAILPLGFWLGATFPGPETIQGTDYRDQYNVALWRARSTPSTAGAGSISLKKPE